MTSIDPLPYLVAPPAEPSEDSDPKPTASPPVSGYSARLLLVGGDTADLLKRLRLLPAGTVGRIRLADDVEQALELLGEECCDLILIDVAACGADFDAIYRLSSTAPDIPRVTLADANAEPRAAESTRHGATDYALREAISGYRLEHLVRSATERRRASEARSRHTRALEEQRARDRQEIERQRALLETVVQAAPIGLVYLDRELRVTSVNAAYCKLRHVKAGLLLGQPFNDAALPGVEQRAMYRRVLGGEVIDLQNVAYQDEVDRRPRYCDLYYRPVLEPGGGIGGLVCAVVDVTVRYELERQKDEFLSLASHELRTPVTAIKGYAQILLRRARETRDEKSLRPLTIMEDQIERLVRLINDLLDVTRVERAALPLYPERFDLRQLLHDAADNCKQTAPDFSITLDLPAGSLEVRADRHRIEQVIVNLLENAVKYSRKDRRVEVSLHFDGAEAVTSVRDYGVGIPIDQQEQVFDRFFRGRNAGSHARNGLGLGLYICRDIVNRHGGRIWLNSAQEQGSTFYFSLPVSD